jgi:uncharacterized membrane protein YhaH (DUF805 family)
VKEYLLAWQRYGDFSGRTRRREFWIFNLLHGLILLAFVLLGIWSAPAPNADPPLGIIVLIVVYLLAAAVPHLAITARRLHDVGYSGWMQLLALIPYVGGLILLIFNLLDSVPGENRWGGNPKFNTSYGR